MQKGVRCTRLRKSVSQLPPAVEKLSHVQISGPVLLILAAKVKQEVQRFYLIKKLFIYLCKLDALLNHGKCTQYYAG